MNKSSPLTGIIPHSYRLFSRCCVRYWKTYYFMTYILHKKAKNLASPSHVQIREGRQESGHDRSILLSLALTISVHCVYDGLYSVFLEFHILLWKSWSCSSKRSTRPKMYKYRLETTRHRHTQAGIRRDRQVVAWRTTWPKSIPDEWSNLSDTAYSFRSSLQKINNS